ncbi:hypothetical protein Pst134EB_025202 [Puccinia striiformis f. sp. tritici]|nr:hypothetical protein Pst134EB_025202 [Puccinia striiformis f. sp. tritici]
MAPINSPSNNVTLDKHWQLRPGLALYIEDALKEEFPEIPHPIFNNLVRMTLDELNVLDCYEEANACDPLRTRAVLDEWFPHQGDWDRFFPTMALLQSTSHHSSREGPPISFAGSTVEDAKMLLELDFKAPHLPPHNAPQSHGTLPKKSLQNI